MRFRCFGAVKLGAAFLHLGVRQDRQTGGERLRCELPTRIDSPSLAVFAVVGNGVESVLHQARQLGELVVAQLIWAPPLALFQLEE